MSSMIDLHKPTGKPLALLNPLVLLTAFTAGFSPQACNDFFLTLARTLFAYVVWRRHRQETFEQLEDALHSLLNDTGLHVLTDVINRHRLQQPHRVIIDDVPHTMVLPDSGLTIITPYGPVVTSRALYRQHGLRPAKGVVALGLLERRLGLIGHQTSRMARICARFEAHNPSRLAHELMTVAGLVSPGRSALDRFGRFVGAALADAMPETLKTLRAEVQAPQGVALMLASLDRVSVPMHEEVAEETATKEALARPRRRPYKRKPPSKFEIHYRMVFVACLSLYDHQGMCLGTLRYGAPADADPSQLAQQVASDVAWVRRSNPEAGLDVCLDGALDLWKVLLLPLEALSGPPLRKVVDWYHFWERTHPVLKLLFDEVSLNRWKKSLQKQTGRLVALERAMLDRMVELPSQAIYDEVDKYLNYLEKRKGLFEYGAQVDDERHLGSGTVEASCKLVVTMRLKRGGQRWKTDGVKAIVALSATANSRPLPERRLPQLDRWEQVWTRFSQRFISDIQPFPVAA